MYNNKMLIKRPVETARITQNFGESKACVKTDVNKRATYPIQIIGKRYLTCPAGYQDFYTTVLGMKAHNGEDRLVYYREPLYFSGIAETKWWGRSEVDSAGGVGVDVFSLDPVSIKEEDLPKEMGELAKREWRENRGKIRVKIRHWHLQDVNLADKPMIEIGKHGNGSPQLAPEIQTGDLIGWCNSTGASSANHLHWSIKFVTQNALTLDSNNGYMGACDLRNFYQDEFILDLYGKKPILTPSQKISRLILSVKEKKTQDILRNLSSFLYASGE